MKSPENDKWLDEALSDVFGSKKPQTDFIHWKQSHPEIVKMLTSRESRKVSASLSSLATRRIILRSPIIKLAAAVMIIIGILAITIQVRHLNSKIGVTDSLESEVLWPYEYEELPVCTIPTKMHVGMYVQVKNCKEKKLILEQVDCDDIGKDSSYFPCYLGCMSLDVRANFDVKIGASIEKVGDLKKNWSLHYDGADTVHGDGNYHRVKVFVKAWRTQVLKAVPGDEVHIGEIHITVKPDA